MRNARAARLAWHSQLAMMEHAQRRNRRLALGVVVAWGLFFVGMGTR